MSSELPTHSPADGLKVYRLAWTFYLILAITGVIWIGSIHGTIDFSLFLDSETWWIDVTLGLISGLGLVGLWDTGRRFLPAMRDLELLLARQIGHLTPSEAMVLALISGFAEELFFRGAMQSSWGFGWATAIFTLMHSGSDRILRYWMIFAFIAGLVFGGLTLQRGTVLAAIVAHIVVNAINLSRLTMTAQIDD